MDLDPVQLVLRAPVTAVGRHGTRIGSAADAHRLCLEQAPVGRLEGLDDLLPSLPHLGTSAGARPVVEVEVLGELHLPDQLRAARRVGATEGDLTDPRGLVDAEVSLPRVEVHEVGAGRRAILPDGVVGLVRVQHPAGRVVLAEDAVDPVVAIADPQVEGAVASDPEAVPTTVGLGERCGVGTDQVPHHRLHLVEQGRRLLVGVGLHLDSALLPHDPADAPGGVVGDAGEISLHRRSLMS